jgi:oligopeptide/dipeptide ABC transporter ATP-binding protein
MPEHAPPDDLLRVESLTTHIPVRGGILGRRIGVVHAVDDVSFTMKAGETLGLVGESGCGKTTTGRSILRLQPATSGKVVFDGRDVFALSAREMKALRADMQVVFQDPSSALDPRMDVTEAVAEGLAAHGVSARAERQQRVREMLDRVGLSAHAARRYPHELSGGQRQRVVIARALALRPRFVVCDEAVSALDVSIQAQVLNLLGELKRELSLTYLFIAHDLSVVQYFSDRVGVMYLGRLVELGGAEELYARPLHPYTRALLAAAPNPDPDAARRSAPLQGDLPSPLDPPSGCRFRTRCPVAIERCAVETPPLRRVRGVRGEQLVACHRVDDDGQGPHLPPIENGVEAAAGPGKGV